MLTTVPIRLTRPTPAQQHILNDTTRFRVVACGRRFGKTQLAKHECILRALQGQHIWYCTPTYRLASKVFRGMAQVVKAVPGVEINKSNLRLELPTGGWIECVSLQEPDNLRGSGLDFVVVDEAAFIADGVWDSVLRPMLSTTEGGALFPSSPYGRNWYWRAFNRGLDPLQPQWASHHFTSAEGGLIRPGEMADIKASTPERIYREEYLAEFLEDSGSVFRGVDDAVRVTPPQAPTSAGRYVFGVDWGKDNDYTVIAVIDRTTAHVVHLDRFNQIGWAFQRGRLAALCAVWNPAVIWAEANSIGSVNIEALQVEGLPVQPFQTTSRSKGPLIEALALAIERGDIGLLDDPVLLTELKAYELQRMPAGAFKYSAPSGSHDDTVIAVALAWHGVNNTMPFFALY